MASGGEVPGAVFDSARSEHLSQRICQPCLNEDNLIVAIGLCVDCQDYLCLKCFHNHQSQQHRVLDREQIVHRQTQAAPEDVCSDSCTVHENEVIQYYCLSHCHLGCKSCIQLDHATCNKVQYIPNVSKELINNEDCRQVDIQMKAVLYIFMNVFQNAQRNYDELDKSCTDSLRELQYFKRQIDEVLENAERELAKEVQALKLKAEQELAQMRNKYKAAHDALQTSLAKIEVFQNANQNCNAYIEMMRTKENINSLDNEKHQAEVDISYRQSPIQFTPNIKLFEIFRSLEGFGTVSSTGTRNVLFGSDGVPMGSEIDTRSIMALSDDFTVLSHETESRFSDNDVSVITDTGSRISHPSLRTGNVQTWLHTVSNVSGEDTGGIMLSGSAYGNRYHHVQDLNVKTERDNYRCVITGMVLLPDSRLVLTESNNFSIKAMDVQTGQVVAQLQLENQPWDITFIETNIVAITMPLRHELFFITVEDDNLNIEGKLTVGGDYNLILDRTLSVDGRCMGVDYKHCKFAVSFINPHKVQIINLQGRVLHNIASDVSGEALFNAPYYLTFGQDDTTLYVSNNMDNNVVCVKVDGTVVATYTDRYLRGPRKSVLDSSGNVYVCEQGSKTVHHITKDCEKLQVLLTQADGLYRPWSICLSEDEDKLYVGMSNDYLKVYAYQ